MTNNTASAPTIRLSHIDSHADGRFTAWYRPLKGGRIFDKRFADEASLDKWLASKGVAR